VVVVADQATVGMGFDSAAANSVGDIPALYHRCHWAELVVWTPHLFI